MSNYTSKSIFSEFLEFVVETFEIRHRELTANSGKVDVSENNISTWKTKNAPSPGKYSLLRPKIKTVLESRTKKLSSYLKKDKFILHMDTVFTRHELEEEWNNIKNEAKTYDDLIVRCFDLCHEYRNTKKVTKNKPSKNAAKKAVKPKKIVVFDLDGTLIKGIKYSWRLLYQAVDLSIDQCKVNKKKFVHGEISYPDWVRYDCDALKKNGLTKEIAQKAIKEKCKLTVNFYEAIKRLKDAGCVVGIISGGADIVLYTMIPDANELFDNNIYINKIKFDDRTGKIVNIEATPYDWDDDGKLRGVSGKNEGLRKICTKYGMNLNDAVFIGDDDNDFKAMRLAGKKILYYSCQPHDETVGNGCRETPGGLIYIIEDDLNKVADAILRDI